MPIRLTFVVLLMMELPVFGEDPIEARFAARGGFETVVEFSTGPGGEFTLFHPSNAGADGATHPVITWGNGTLAIPLFYFELLDHLASHGFVVIASNSPMTGTGEEMIQGVNWVLRQNEDPTSPLFGAIDVDSIGATGHSQGGAGAINAGNDPRVACTAPIEPVPGNVSGLTGPMFVVAGERDSIVPARTVAKRVYAPSLVPTIFAILSGATHLDPLRDGGGFRGYVTAWFAACLSGDKAAKRAFLGGCSLCANEEWRVFRKSRKRAGSKLQRKQELRVRTKKKSQPAGHLKKKSLRFSRRSGEQPS